jgi:hypothetical protein
MSINAVSIFKNCENILAFIFVLLKGDLIAVYLLLIEAI